MSGIPTNIQINKIIFERKSFILYLNQTRLKLLKKNLLDKSYSLLLYA